jgi:hypothetical protein
MAPNMSEEHELDLSLAGELQRALLPRGVPSDWPHYKAAARSRMCTSVGGDFHDFIRINQDQIAVVVGDVMGHGVRASLIMAQILGFLRLEQERLPRPIQIVSALCATAGPERPTPLAPMTFFWELRNSSLMRCAIPSSPASAWSSTPTASPMPTT